MTNPFEASGLSNYVSSLIRTWVPVAIGAIAAWLSSKVGFIVDEDTKTAGIAFFTGLLISAYYALVRYIEIKVPKFGWLLGLAKLPGYAPKDPPAPSPGPNPDL